MPPVETPPLLVATTNIGKIAEIQHGLEGLPVRLLTLADLPAIDPPEETGRTFAENARIKAEAYARASGLPTVAEDSGLAIDALGGRPGIESARYPGRTYPEKFARLYGELAGAPEPWTAQFVCALAFIDRDRVHGREDWFATEGVVHGVLAREAVGTGGFGYDPIFYYPAYRTTLANVDRSRKMAVSHRGQAFRRLREWLSGPAATG